MTQGYYYDDEPEPPEESRRTLWIGIGLAAAVLLACACVLCLALAVFIYLEQSGPTEPAPEEQPTLPPPIPVEQIQNISWQWNELIETEAASQTVVPNPQVYLLVFRPDGQLHLNADCNAGNGAYAVQGNRMTVVLGAMTLAACPPGSLSNQYLALLSNVGAFSMDGDRLVLYLLDEAGHLVFANGGPAEAEPAPPSPELTPDTGQAPQPVINAPAEAAVAEEITFDGSQSQPGSSPIAGYGWDFGDGSTAEGATVTHAYSQPGSFQVTLTVRDADGLGNVATVQIVIMVPEAPEPTPTPESTSGLVGPIWKWTEIGQEGGQEVVPDPESYTLTFNADNTFNFQADCNSGSGTYMVDGTGLRLDLGALSEADCGPDSLSNQYLALLSTVESYEFEGDRLILRLVGDAGHFVFVP